MLLLVNLYRVIDNLISLSENKYQQLKEIYLLTQKQTDFIEDGDMVNLSNLIDRKQEKIDLILTFDSQFEAITDDIKILYNVKSLDELEIEANNIYLLKEIISNVTELLKQIIEIENSNREKMNTAKNALEVKMSTAKTGKTAIKQYNGLTGYADAVFFDKKIK